MSVRRPRVSVIIPVFGRPGLAIEAVASARRQSGVEVEIIVVDDGSIEDMTSLRRAVDGVGLYVRRDHEGIAPARNAGARIASGEWLAFLDSDDVFYPGKISAQVAAAAGAERAWSYCGFDLVDHAAGTVQKQELPSLPERFWRTACPFGATSVVVRAEAFRSLGGFDEQFGVCEDWDLFIRLGELSPPAAVADALYAYRLGCGNVTGENHELWFGSWARLCEKHGIEPGLFSYPGIAHSPEMRRRFDLFCAQRAA